jgi:hypothetical protein
MQLYQTQIPPIKNIALLRHAKELAVKAIDPELERAFNASYERASAPIPGGHNACPTRAFCEAVFRVTGVPDCAPGHVIPAIRSDQMPLIEAVHAELMRLQSPAA